MSTTTHIHNDKYCVLPHSPIPYINTIYTRQWHIYFEQPSSYHTNRIERRMLSFKAIIIKWCYTLLTLNVYNIIGKYSWVWHNFSAELSIICNLIGNCFELTKCMIKLINANTARMENLLRQRVIFRLFESSTVVRLFSARYRLG